MATTTSKYDRLRKKTELPVKYTFTFWFVLTTLAVYFVGAGILWACGYIIDKMPHHGVGFFSVLHKNFNISSSPDDIRFIFYAPWRVMRNWGWGILAGLVLSLAGLFYVRKGAEKYAKKLKQKGKTN